MAPVILSLLSIGTALIAVILIRRRWRFTDTPTSDAAHVFPGLGEVQGTVEALGPPLLAASDGRQCVWWRYKVEREHKRDKNTEWVTEEEGVSAVPFSIRDDSGTVTVVLSDSVSISRVSSADIDHLSLDFIRPYAKVMKKTFEPSNFLGGLFGSNDTNEPISDFGGRWRASEQRLLIGDHVFLAAHARLVDSGAAVEMAPTDADGKNRSFELTVGDETAAIKSHANPWLIGALGIASLVLGSIAGSQMAKATGLIIALTLLLLVALATFVIGAYNRVTRARGRGEFAWSLIDVACQQRSSVIPQLNAVVGAAMSNEQQVLTSIASVRDLGRRPTAETAAAVRQSSDASNSLVARIEAMPNLTTQPNVAQLIEQLRLLNDRVAFARRFYNDSVTRLTDRLTQFPDSSIAKFARVTELPLLDP